MKKILCLVIVILGGRLQAQDQQQLIFGATTNVPGATLVFETGSNYITASGYCFPTVSGTLYDPNIGYDFYPYAGYYYNCVQIFNALPATGDNGGPADGAAALGTVMQLQLLSAEGPAGASFAFWEGNSDGSYGTNLTWSVPVPSTGDTNRILLTQAANTLSNDPYGYIQNRVFGFSEAGLYKLTWRLIDTSTNGPGGTPLNTNSAPFALYYQADCTISGITSETDGIHLSFAAPKGALVLYRNFVAILRYKIFQSSTLDADANWSPVLDSDGNAIQINGDDYLHTNTVPAVGACQFYRLNVIIPPSGGT